MSEFRIVPLSEIHLPDILAIEETIESAPWSEASFRHELHHPDGIFLVGVDRGRIVGYAGAWCIVDEAHITTVGVVKDRQRQGFGGKIVRELLATALAKGMRCATLEVRAGNAAGIALYEKLGFVRVGLRKRYYPDNQEDAVIMWLYDLGAMRS